MDLPALILDLSNLDELHKSGFLSKRTFGSLNAAGFNTAGDVRSAGIEKITQFAGIGRVSLDEIKAVFFNADPPATTEANAGRSSLSFTALISRLAEMFREVDGAEAMEILDFLESMLAMPNLDRADAKEAIRQTWDMTAASLETSRFSPAAQWQMEWIEAALWGWHDRFDRLFPVPPPVNSLAKFKETQRSKKQKRLTSKLQSWKAYAASRGGTCLSTEYTGAKVKLEWQCADQHTWAATPFQATSVWCPICAKKR